MFSSFSSTSSRTLLSPSSTQHFYTSLLSTRASSTASRFAGLSTPSTRRFVSHATSSALHRSGHGLDAALRYSRNGSNLHAQRLFMLALAAFALERARLDSHTIADYNVAGSAKPVDKTLGARLKRALLALKRVGTLAILATPVALAAPVAYVTGDILPSLSDMVWEYSLWGIEVAGPTFIKLTQWASTRSDLFPAEFCLRFARLQDATRGHSWDDTAITLRKEFGDDWETRLEIDDSKLPIGSGCIAQVYHGRILQPVGLQKEGQEVAIKIVHPHIREKVEMDFYIMDKVTKFLEGLPRLNLEFLSLSDSVEQFREVMVPQLDLRCEAKNLDRFILNFADNDQVKFPEPKKDFVTENVLVEGFVKGDRILSYLNPKAATKDKQVLAKLGVMTVMNMIFMHDFVHGDLHPGNILVTRNADKELCLNLLDCGIVVEMGESDHKNLINILGALVKKDGWLAGKLMVDTAKHTRATEDDVEAFCKGIQRICIEDEDENFLEKVGDYLADICDMACRHKVKLESKFINASLAVEIMEGIATKLYPEMIVQEIALPLVLKAEVLHGIRKAKVPSFMEALFGKKEE